MNKTLTNITSSSKMSDIIISNPNTITVLERLNIPFGFGDKKIVEIATEGQIEPSAFISILRIFSGNKPEEAFLEKESIRNILSFLEASHLYFKEKQIPEIKELIKLFSDTLPLKHGNLIISFFDEYIREINEHFLYEEETVFPYIKSIIDESKTISFEIREFEKNHTDIEQKLLDLKHILIKYVPGNIVSPYRLQILKKLNTLEEDLFYHSSIEDFILVPSIKKMEKLSKRKKI